MEVTDVNKIIFDEIQKRFGFPDNLVTKESLPKGTILFGDFLYFLELEFNIYLKEEDVNSICNFKTSVDCVMKLLNDKPKPIRSPKNADKHPEVTEYVVCAACRRTDGLIVCAPRHYDPTMRAIMNVTGGPDAWKHCDQGFVNQWGDFLSREDAHQLATKNNQFRRSCGGDRHILFSENLY